MKTRIGTLVTLGLVLAIVRIGGQAPPPAAGGTPSPGFDLSGYWTAAMHEDAPWTTEMFVEAVYRDLSKQQ